MLPTGFTTGLARFHHFQYDSNLKPNNLDLPHLPSPHAAVAVDKSFVHLPFPSSVSSEHGSVAKTSGPGLIGKEAMARYQQLFNQLMDGEAANPEELDLEALDAGIDNLQLVATQSAADDKRRGPPSCPVKVVGDPEIVDCKGRYFHYLGPALLVNLDCRGMVRSLEFVGVQGGKKDSNYIREVWQYDVKTQKFKYRDLRDMQGYPAHRIKCKDAGPRKLFYGDGWFSRGDVEFHAGGQWDSEKDEDAKPPRSFQSKFQKNSETFLVHLQDGTFMRGPKYGRLKEVIEQPQRFLKSLIAQCQRPDEWMRQAAACITNAPFSTGVPSEPSRAEQAVQVAQVVFGLIAGKKARVAKPMPVLDFPSMVPRASQGKMGLRLSEEALARTTSTIAPCVEETTKGKDWSVLVPKVKPPAPKPPSDPRCDPLVDPWGRSTSALCEDGSVLVPKVKPPAPKPPSDPWCDPLVDPWGRSTSALCEDGSVLVPKVKPPAPKPPSDPWCDPLVDPWGRSSNAAM